MICVLIGEFGCKQLLKHAAVTENRLKGQLSALREENDEHIEQLHVLRHELDRERDGRMEFERNMVNTYIF